MDEGDQAKVTSVCVFGAEESHAALRLFAQVITVTDTSLHLSLLSVVCNLCSSVSQVFNKLIRRYKYLEKAFEEEVKKVGESISLQLFVVLVVVFEILSSPFRLALFSARCCFCLDDGPLPESFSCTFGHSIVVYFSLHLESLKLNSQDHLFNSY